MSTRVVKPSILSVQVMRIRLLFKLLKCVIVSNKATFSFLALHMGVLVQLEPYLKSYPTPGLEALKSKLKGNNANDYIIVFLSFL